jgi:phosphate transport system substrate-binding protein
MSQSKETVVLLFSLVITGSILGGGAWFFTRNANVSPQPQPSPSLPAPPEPTDVSVLAEPTQVAKGTQITIDGSTSMVGINQALKSNFEQKFPGTLIQTDAKGTDKGILGLLTGVIDIAAISRPLTAQEQSQGLAAIPVAKDVIAIVVGLDNPFRKGLTEEQVKDIFQGKITNWSQVGGQDAPIKVINRPPISGTYQMFQSLVLGGENFGKGDNFVNMERDATTPILQALGKNGISYATNVQIKNQQTVRSLEIDGLTPEATNYPFFRTLYYAYKKPATTAIKDFLGYATSPTGQQVIATVQQN